MLLPIVLLSAGVGASPALAKGGASEAPPGNSAVDQYRESVPPSSSNSRRLTRSDRAALEREGRDGQALANALERSGGVPRASAAADGGSQRGTTTPRRSSGSGRAAPDSGEGRESAATAERSEHDSRPIAPAAAASTVGPVPVGVLLAAAVGLVGLGLAIRTRPAR